MWNLKIKRFGIVLINIYPPKNLEKKLKNKEGYILLNDNKAIGLLRYNFFWDNIPFCTMLSLIRNFKTMVMVR